MSTDAPTQAEPPLPSYIAIHGHSNILYWWPIWLISFVFAGITYASGDRMAVVPPNSQVATHTRIEGFAEPRDALVTPPGTTLDLAADGATDRISGSNNMGVVFVALLMFVVMGSTVTLRGLVSLIVIITLTAAVIILALLGLWDPILRFLGGLAIRINATAYLAIGAALFVLWVVVIFLYDRQMYVIFDQGQIRVKLEVGDSETVMDANGAVVEKLRNDVFRHWILGLGAGDLRVRTSGTNARTVEIDNVKWIGWKLTLIQRFLKEREVTAAVASPAVGVVD